MDLLKDFMRKEVSVVMSTDAPMAEVHGTLEAIDDSGFVLLRADDGTTLHIINCTWVVDVIQEGKA